MNLTASRQDLVFTILPFLSQHEDPFSMTVSGGSHMPL